MSGTPDEAVDHVAVLIGDGDPAAALVRVVSTLAPVPLARLRVDVVAVPFRTPVATAETHALIALCSLSTATYSASQSPLFTNSEQYSTMKVCGVIG